MPIIFLLGAIIAEYWAVIAVVAFVALAAAMYFLMPKGKNVEQQIQKLEIPSTEPGRPIPVLFGTRPIKGPIITEYGDVRIIKAEIDSGGKK